MEVVHFIYDEGRSPEVGQEAVRLISLPEQDDGSVWRHVDGVGHSRRGASALNALWALLFVRWWSAPLVSWPFRRASTSFALTTFVVFIPFASISVLAALGSPSLATISWPWSSLGAIPCPVGSARNVVHLCDTCVILHT